MRDILVIFFTCFSQNIFSEKEYFYSFWGHILQTQQVQCLKDQFRYVHSKWEMSLHCNDWRLLLAGHIPRLISDVSHGCHNLWNNEIWIWICNLIFPMGDIASLMALIGRQESHGFFPSRKPSQDIFCDYLTQILQWVLVSFSTILVVIIHRVALSQTICTNWFNNSSYCLICWSIRISNKTMSLTGQPNCTFLNTFDHVMACCLMVPSHHLIDWAQGPHFNVVFHDYLL